MEVTLETIAFLENTVFPKIAERWRNEGTNEEQQILPHRLPLKRRLAEFRYGTSLARRTSLSTSPNLSGTNSSNTGSTPSCIISTAPGGFFSNLWAIERFRDITPAFVMAIFEESLVLEPGDVGPLPLSHPVAQHLIECVNGQRLSRGLLATLREYGAPFYDGCVLVGIVDYRRWAFGGSKAEAKTTTVTPEMHKILLKMPFELLLEDIPMIMRMDADKIFPSPVPVTVVSGEKSPVMGNGSPRKSATALAPSVVPSSPEPPAALAKITDKMGLEVETKLLMALAPPICLDSNPLVARVMTALNYVLTNCAPPSTIKSLFSRINREGKGGGRVKISTY